MKQDKRQFRSRKTRKQALHISQHREQATEKKEAAPGPTGLGAVVAAAISLLQRRHQSR